MKGFWFFFSFLSFLFVRRLSCKMAGLSAEQTHRWDTMCQRTQPSERLDGCFSSVRCEKWAIINHRCNYCTYFKRLSCFLMDLRFDQQFNSSRSLRLWWNQLEKYTHRHKLMYQTACWITHLRDMRANRCLRVQVRLFFCVEDGVSPSEGTLECFICHPEDMEEAALSRFDNTHLRKSERHSYNCWKGFICYICFQYPESYRYWVSCSNCDLHNLTGSYK